MTAIPAEHESRVPQIIHQWFAVPTDDEDLSRLSRLFNILMLMSVLFSLLFALVYLFANNNGWIETSLTLLLQMGFALSFVPLGLFCWWQTKRGNIRSTFTLYIWLCGLIITAGVALFGGSRSPWWVLYFWPLSLSGIFLSLWYAPVMVIGVLFYYVVLFYLIKSGIYVPLVPQSPDLFWFVNQALILMLLTAIPGIATFLNVWSTRDYLEKLTYTAANLEQTRSELVTRVDARTSVLRKRAEQFQAIAELSHAASSIRNLQELLDTTTQLVTEQLGFYHAGIFLIDPTNVWAVLRSASSGGGQQMLARGHRLRVGQQGLVGYVSETGLARRVSSVGEDAVWVNNPDLPDTQAEVALPLIAQDTMMGVLDIQTTVEAAFSEEDEAVLRILADNIAIAIANTRSFEETHEALARLSRYQEQDALRAWQQALARRDMRLDYVYASGLVNRAETTKGEEKAVAQTIATLRAVRTSEPRPGVHLLEAPITIRRQKLGVLSFEKDIPWTNEQVQLTSFVVQQLNLALENAQLLEETSLRANQQRARSEIMTRLRVGGSTDAIMRSAVEELGRALHVDRSRIQLLPQGEDAR